MRHTSHHGFYQLTRIPFGLKNASAILQLVMNSTVMSNSYQVAVVYFHDLATLLTAS